MAAIDKPSGPKAVAGSSWWEKTVDTRTAYAYLVPAFIVMAIITFYPLIYQVWMSFTDYGVRSLNPNSAVYLEPTWVGFQNYADIFSGRISNIMPNFDFWRLLAFNLLWTFSNVIFHVGIGILIAVVLNIHGLWFKGIYRSLYVLPMVIPSLVIAVVWRNMFDPDFGAINQGLNIIRDFAGLEPLRIRWIDETAPVIDFWGLLPLPMSFFAVLITNIWLGWPFMTIVATGALQSVPKDLYEAASIDGASWTQQFFNITLPMIRPAMVPAAMYGTILTFNQFNVIYFISGGGPLRQTEIMVTTAFRLVNEQREYGLAASFSVIIFFVLLGLTLLTNQVTRATESYDDA
ncbi:MAG TPA: sugar ABC transporter permease [Anaerolineae bacterium]|nr:sugar ABC transporter permease [Anaerolineae bacterium]